MREKSRSNRGQVIVELALVLPFLTLLMAGILDFGVAIYDQSMLANASRQGARVAIGLVQDSGGNCYQVPYADIKAAVDNYLSGKLINLKTSPQWNVSSPDWQGFSPACNPNGGTVMVQVTYQHTFLIIPAFGLNKTIPMAAQTTMDRQ
jgi:Flp pilus assembly protein TadG